MSSQGSGMVLGLESQPSCSALGPGPRNSLLARPLPPPWSCSLALLGQEDIVESYTGSSCELGVALLDCNCPAPDPQLVRRIVAQVEFYLSDENLARDAFLLKHVRKNKMGFVSIKLLTSFKKVKYLTRDWRLTLYALKFSALLEVNREGTKVRRRLPIPEHLLSVTPSKVLLAWELQPREQDLPLQDGLFLETITSMFSPFGAVASIRLLRPGRKLPADVRRYSARFPELLSRCCALVEYESLESARRAFESLGHRDWHSIRVVRLCGKGGKKKAGEEQAGWKVPAALSFPCSLEDSLPGSSPEPDDASGSLSILLNQDLVAPTWPGSDFGPGNSNSLPGSLLTSKGFPPLRMGLGTESCGGWTPWSSSPCAAAQPAPSSALAAQWVPEPLSLWDGVLCLPPSPEGTKGFGRGELVLRH